MLPKAVAVRIKRFTNQHSLILAAVISIVLVNMASLHHSIDAAAQSNRQEEHHHHHFPPPYYNQYNANNWFSAMNSSLSSSLSLIQSFLTESAGAPSSTTASGDSFLQNYDWSQSTEYNYRSEQRRCIGKFRAVRQQLDHSYHQSYKVERQAVQDSIMEQLLKETKIVDVDTGQECHLPAEPWIIFTAGVYGAGKTHTIKKLHERDQFPLDSFVAVDPDEIRRHLPEFPVYIEKSPEKAGELTRKEVGMMAEIVTNFALQKGMNVLVDGSLKDAAWYENYFRSLRQSYPKLKIGIIHVTAPTDAILERVQERAKTTGRVVPMDALQRSIREVPVAVKRLRSSVDYFLEIHNPSEPPSSSKMTGTSPAFLPASVGSTAAAAAANPENKFHLKCAVG
ncbi:zeta toxin family protein [Nitzschia inconspicua]|uniref:Zeta toxin family protein n=1 Tax=Nitzschia inconspicua TaxID=303405 RepID=A0A9K3PVJ8_9STRA|nr:zeta toxin family protein [Nitzschia inconspicua]